MKKNNILQIIHDHPSTLVLFLDFLQPNKVRFTVQQCSYFSICLLKSHRNLLLTTCNNGYVRYLWPLALQSAAMNLFYEAGKLQSAPIYPLPPPLHRHSFPKVQYVSGVGSIWHTREKCQYPDLLQFYRIARASLCNLKCVIKPIGNHMKIPLNSG